MDESKTVKTWTKTSVTNLIRHRSGRYYARLYSGGKERWKSLGTDVLEVAKVKVRGLAGAAEKVSRSKRAHQRGRMTFGDAAVIFEQRLADGYGLHRPGRKVRRIRPRAVKYRLETLAALWKSWPELRSMDVRKMSEADAEAWATKLALNFSPTRYNGTLETLRALILIAQEAGALADDPTEKVARESVPQKKLALPERAQFIAMVKAIREAGGRFSADCADLVEFLAYTGARLSEAAAVTWRDVDLVKLRTHLRVVKGGKNPRYVPMIAEAVALLTRMRGGRAGEEQDEPVLRVHEAQKSMDRAAKIIGAERITHHDLRHLFATTVIESGVDIPTASRWLGHVDGGALAMRTYGHLRDEHSQKQAALVSYAK
jgi:integrase